MSDKRPFSSQVFDGADRAPSRAMLYAVGFEKEDKSYCFLLLMMGIVSFILFFMMTKIVLANIYYSSAIPGDISSLINYLKVERNLIGISSFFLINSLLLIPIFIKNKPIFFLMLLIMSPNIFGNIGGAEKTNFYTHKKSLYLLNTQIY